MFNTQIPTSAPGDDATLESNSPDQIVSRRLDGWNAQLLDLSKRNRLLFFNPLVSSSVRAPHGVKLAEPSCDALWNRLARLGKTQTFPDLESEFEQILDAADDEESDDEDNDDSPPPRRILKTDEISTEPSGDRLGRLLTNLRSKARTSLEEGGIVTLFVAFGFLRWQEDGKTDLYAPLLLVPVDLVRSSAREPVQLRRHEEEVLLNPALKYKLETDWKIALPEAPSLDAKSLEFWWDEVGAALEKSPVAAKGAWSVFDWAYLGLFSFHKMAMFRDLRDHRALLMDHPIVRALGGDKEVQVNGEIEVPHGDELDQVATAEMELVTDADSSQHEAIIAARRGVSFVLQGPPGTGKSQTITNIIAECLENDKKVLFVSEKMAALEVVQTRLKAAGLGDFCLEAHSHKANKRAVVGELDRTLRLARLAAPALTADDTDLTHLRGHLNSYVAELHLARAPSNLSLHAAMGHLAGFAAAPRLEFSFLDPMLISPSQRAKLEDWLRDLGRLDAVWRQAKTHPWRGVRLPDAGLQARETLRARCLSAATSLDVLAREWGDFCALWGVARYGSLFGALRMLELARIVAQGADLRPETVATWLEAGELEPLRAVARQQGDRAARLRARREVFEAKWQPPIFALDAPRLEEQIADAAPWIERAGGDAAVLGKRAELEKHLGAAHHLGEVERTGSALAATLGIDAPLSLAGAIETLKIAQIADKRARPLPAWFAPGALAELEAAAQSAREDTERRRVLAADLEARWNLEALLALPCEALATRFATQYGGFLARMGGSFKADRALVLGALRDARSFSPGASATDLRLAQELSGRRLKAQTESPSQSARFGTYWQGDATDWEALAVALSVCRDLSIQLGAKISDGLVGVLCGPSGTLDLARLQNRDLEAALSLLHLDFKALGALISLRDLPFTSLPFAHAPLVEARDWLTAGRLQLSGLFAAIDAIDACRAAAFTPGLAERLAALNEAAMIQSEIAAFEMAAEGLRASFGPHFEGQETQWATILSALDWSDRILEWFGANPIPTEFRAVLSDPARRAAASERAAAVAAQVAALQPALVGLQGCFDELKVADRPLEQAEMSAVSTFLGEKAIRYAELEDWLAYEQILAQARDLGLSHESQGVENGGFWEQLHTAQERGEAPALDAVSGAFWKRFWTLWIDQSLSQVPPLRAFTGQSHDDAIERFARLDSEGQGRARERLRAFLSGKKPVLSLNAPRAGQLAVLQKEAVKKSRHLPLRQLFEQTAEIVQALKPCMLMSPLSVAQFLPPGKIKFDVVVFDEASQIGPPDAIGAIVRGAQVVVVGDNKQMPPTNFFGAASDDDSDDEEGANMESILDECIGAGLSQWRLLWHYRSKFEELIQFSNAHFYNGDLLTFPGPAVPISASDEGAIAGGGALSWEKVDGFYTPGGSAAGGDKKNAQTNRIEARHVAQMCVEHAQNCPHESLGVITFNEAQRRAVEEEIVVLTAQSPALDAFFSGEREDGFFIKALENVQGDERDVIFFSVGFGPRRTKDGQILPMLLNFGPLGKEGGERRLNVAVTRARSRVKIVTSFEPAAIDPDRIKRRGPKLLRAYLEWAKSGSQAAQSESGAARGGSAAQDAVGITLGAALQNAGWRVHQRVGLGDFRVDVGVEDPDEPGRMLLGVLCDGDNYCDAATARDRDRLRPFVLERLGWQLHRLWSPDWVKNPDRETEKVLAALQSARDAAQLARARAAQSPEQAISDAPEDAFEAVESDLDGEDDELAVTLVDLLAAQPVEESNGDNEEPDSFDNDFDDQEENELESDAEAIESNGATFEPVILARRGDAQSFYLFAGGKIEPILEALIEVVNGEGPVSALVATRRVVAAWEMGRAGGKLQNIVAQVAAVGKKRGLLQIRPEKKSGGAGGGDWYWPQGMERPEARRPRVGGEVRSQSEIALEELAEAALGIIETSYGVSQSELIVLTARFFGWKSAGNRVQARISAALGLLEDDPRLIMQNGNYVLRS